MSGVAKCAREGCRGGSGRRGVQEVVEVVAGSAFEAQ